MWRAVRRPSARRSLLAAIVACIAAMVLAVVAGIIDWAQGSLPGPALALLALAATIGLAGFWVLIGLIDAHFTALERVRGRLIMMRADPDRGARPAADAGGTADDAEAGRLEDAALALAEIWRQAAQAPDTRLAAIVAAVPEPLVAVTETGLVSLVNQRALGLLGPERAALGTSIFAALDDRDLAAARAAARSDGRPVRASLRHADGHPIAVRVVDLGPGHGVLLLPVSDAEAAGGQVHSDLGLHETPPPPTPVGDDTRLDALSAWVLDLETTGLDPRDCRIVALGAIRLHGGRLYRGTMIDLLVNPGLPIPPTASAVHGITDILVATAPGIAAVLPELERSLAGCALVGHNIGFDMAVLAAEAARSGHRWPVAPALDTGLLAAALEPGRRELDLETIAADCGVPATARHTALGDCLIAGEVYARLLPRLADRGITTYGEARAFSRTARHALAHQRAGGWVTP
jgi:DNA polymerase III subunit epsilon